MAEQVERIFTITSNTSTSALNVNTDKRKSKRTTSIHTLILVTSERWRQWRLMQISRESRNECETGVWCVFVFACATFCLLSPDSNICCSGCQWTGVGVKRDQKTFLRGNNSKMFCECSLSYSRRMRDKWSGIHMDKCVCMRAQNTHFIHNKSHPCVLMIAKRKAHCSDMRNLAYYKYVQLSQRNERNERASERVHR